MSVTQAQIARQLGIDQRTVSVAFGASGRISPATRERVLSLAKSLGYRPNRLAAGLRGSATKSIGVVWGFVDPWAGDDVIGLDLLSRLQNRGLATYQIQPSTHPETLCQQLDDLLDRRVDGIVIQAIPSLLQHPDVVERLQSVSAVVAVTRENVASFPGDLVVHDRDPGIRQVVDHFASKGRKRPAMALSMEQESNPPKFEVFRERCARHGLADHPHLLIPMDYPRVVNRHGKLHLEAFRRTFPEAVTIDAVFCFNDIGALYVMRELQDRGLRVPDDVAVVGFNNTEAGQIARPVLATGDRKHRDVADAVEQMLQARLEAPELPPQRKTVPMEFVWHESAG